MSATASPKRVRITVPESLIPTFCAALIEEKRLAVVEAAALTIERECMDLYGGVSLVVSRPVAEIEAAAVTAMQRYDAASEAIAKLTGERAPSLYETRRAFIARVSARVAKEKTDG